MLNINDLEIIKAQDHCYWIYSNSMDAYYETDISWNQTSEENFIKYLQTLGIQKKDWINDPGIDL